MERKTLSANLLWDKIFFSFFGVILLIVCINQSFSPWELPAVFAVFSGIIFYSIFYLPDTIEFDDTYLYVTRKNGEISVDLKDIYMMKITTARLNHRNMWKIKYKMNGINAAARFYPPYSRDAFNEFANIVKSKNPAFEIKNFTWSFDFDQ